jgi:hypothetical protein
MHYSAFQFPIAPFILVMGAILPQVGIKASMVWAGALCDVCNGIIEAVV